MMNSIREEIERRLASNQVYYAHFVTNDSMQQIRNETANDIVKAIEKRIEELRIKHPKDLYKAYNAGLDDVKEMLK